MKEKVEGLQAKANVKALQAVIKPLTNTSNRNSTSNKNNVICYWCNEPGYAKPDCPNKRKEGFKWYSFQYYHFKFVEDASQRW
jgi:hypothetical protein